MNENADYRDYPFPRNKCRAHWQQFAAICREYLAHLRYFEYWPTRLFYFPIYIQVLYWACRLRSLGFMSVVNPCMEFGGLLNYSKSRILQLLPTEKNLRSCLVACQQSLESILQQMELCGLRFPIIAKPDFGERGFAVEVLVHQKQLAKYLERFRNLDLAQNPNALSGSVNADIQNHYRIILQEYFHPAQEFAILYSIAPSEAKCGGLGQIHSICAKQPLFVLGDGQSYLWQLVAGHERASKRFRLLRQMWQTRWYDVLPTGKQLQLTHIGAHSRGTDFYSFQSKNSPQLLHIFAELTKNLNSSSASGQLNFTFGRYDILATDWDSVLYGQFKVIELNGVNAEPIHIYQPKLPLWQAWKTLWQHWQRIGLLAQEMMQQGHKACHARQLFAAIREHDHKLRQYCNSAPKIKKPKYN